MKRFEMAQFVRAAALATAITATWPAQLSFGDMGSYLLTTDWDNSMVHRYDAASGAFIDTFVPKKSGGLNDPVGILFGPHDGNLYASSGQFAGNGEVRGVLRYDGSTGAFIDVFTAGEHLESPRGIIFGPDGNLFVADYSNDNSAGRVIRFDGTTGAYLDDFVPTGSGGLHRPVAVLFGPDANEDGQLDLFVQSAGTSTILHYDGTTGDFLGEFVAAGAAGLDHPTGMVFGPDGNLYVANWAVGEGHQAILRFQGPSGDSPGAPLPSAGNTGADFVAPGTGGLLAPNGLLFGPDANGDGYFDLYVTAGDPTGSYKAKTHTGTIKRYDGITGAFIDTFIAGNPHELRGPFYLTFTETDPVTLNYLGGGAQLAASLAVPEPATLVMAMTCALALGVIRADKRFTSCNCSRT